MVAVARDVGGLASRMRAGLFARLGRGRLAERFARLIGPLGGTVRRMRAHSLAARLWAIAVSVALEGCETFPPSTAASPAAVPAQTAPPETPSVTPSSSSQASSCEVTLRLELIQLMADRRQIRVIAENATNTVVHFELLDRCPNGAVALDGLGPGYDYYGACNAGPCLGQRGPKLVELRPHERRPVADAVIALEGAPPCTKPLAPGRYYVRTLVPSDPRVCGSELPFEVPSPSPPRPIPSPAPPARPTPPAQAGFNSADPYACTSPGDCVLTCPEVAGCCTSACGCRHAIHRAHVKAFEADYPKQCRRPPHCFVEGCDYRPAGGATCQNGRCVATDGSGF